MLDDAARRHALDMAAHEGIVHVGSDGSDGGRRIREAGYQWRQWGEIVGWGFNGDGAAMLQWWQNSPAHAPYVYATNVDEAGVCYLYAPGSRWGHYWVIDFGRRDEVEPEPARPYSVYVPGVLGGGG